MHTPASILEQGGGEGVGWSGCFTAAATHLTHLQQAMVMHATSPKGVQLAMQQAQMQHQTADASQLTASSVNTGHAARKWVEREGLLAELHLGRSACRKSSASRPSYADDMCDVSQVDMPAICVM